MRKWLIINLCLLILFAFSIIYLAGAIQESSFANYRFFVVIFASLGILSPTFFLVSISAYYNLLIPEKELSENEEIKPLGWTEDGKILAFDGHGILVRFHCPRTYTDKFGKFLAEIPRIKRMQRFKTSSFHYGLEHENVVCGRVERYCIDISPIAVVQEQQSMQENSTNVPDPKTELIITVE